MKLHSSHALLFIPVYLVLCASAVGQEKARPVFSHPLTVAQSVTLPRTQTESPSGVSPTLTVLAVMVDFQNDNDSRTTGNGSFDLSGTAGAIIDPPPHNASYFRHHLEFLQNYFRKSSHNKLIVTGIVLDSVYHLAHPMQYYSPSRNSATSIELGRLMQDAWHTVDSVTPGIVFSDYQAFIIFHAGVGRDVDFTSLFGYDPTPFDIPSLYVNPAGLKKMFGPDYEGVPVSGGTFRISSSMILPETESRPVPSAFGGTFLYELGINGLLAASVGSHLNLPDLFDTKTGRSGIGRFGLMDGESIFSWGGVFPPMPSAWERYRLGWVEPITIAHGDSTYRLPAVGLSNSADTVYRVLISEREYFLVENRNRDADSNGATVTMVMNDSTTVRTWRHDSTQFDYTDQRSLFGVITDVDEFDWSLPGFLASDTHVFYDGGILIWHIDENVVDANIASDAVNANPDHRGVDLEEADGSQDIGESYPQFTIGSGSESGTPIDYWYSDNPAPLRIKSNAFTPTSNPGSLSYGYANSHVYMKEFSARGPHMTARIQVGDADVKMMGGFPKQFERSSLNSYVTVSSQLTGNPVFLVGGALLYGWTIDGNPMDGFQSNGELARFARLAVPNSITGKPVVGNFNGGATPGFAATGQVRFINEFDMSPVLDAWTLTDANQDSLADPIFPVVFSEHATSPVLSDSFIVIGGTKGRVWVFRLNGQLLDTLKPTPSDTSAIAGISLIHPQEFLITSAGGTIQAFSPGIIPLVAFPVRHLGEPISGPAAVAAISAQIPTGVAVATKSGSLHLTDEHLHDFSGFPISTGGEILNSPAIADIDMDGRKDIIVFSGNKIYAVNAAGSVLDNFPITVPTSKTILTSPIVADLDGNGTPDIVAVTQDGLVVAYDKTGKMVRGFPLLTGRNGGSTPAAVSFADHSRGGAGIGLAATSDDGNVYAWQTGFLGPLPNDAIPGWIAPWPQYMHDAQNTSLDDSSSSGPPISTNFFPAGRAYNWPNPVDREHGYTTHIRYFLASEAKVHIKIFDLAGDQVTEFDGPGVAGLDNEMQWNVSNIQSGIYFAHIDAQGSGGSGVAIIKIAVVK